MESIAAPPVCDPEKKTDVAMKIHERTIIGRPSAHVWPYISTPELFLQWNEKIASIGARESFIQGQLFTTHYLWKGKQLQCRSVVTKLEPGRLLELQHSQCTGPHSRKDMEIVERIMLEDRGGRSMVTKSVHIRNHGIPWIVRPLIWFVSRFGKPVDPDRLKVMCEGSGR